MLTQRIHHSDDDADCDSNSANGAGVDDHSDDGRDSSDATRTADLHSSARSNAIASSQQPPCSRQPAANINQRQHCEQNFRPLHSEVVPATAATKTEDSEDFLDDTDAVKEILLPSNKNK